MVIQLGTNRFFFNFQDSALKNKIMGFYKQYFQLGRYFRVAAGGKGGPTPIQMLISEQKATSSGEYNIILI